MPRRKMIAPLPDTGQSAHDRFKTFAKALLSVPKTEILSAEETLAKLEADKLKIDAKIVEVRLELKSRSVKHTPST